MTRLMLLLVVKILFTILTIVTAFLILPAKRAAEMSGIWCQPLYFTTYIAL